MNCAERFLSELRLQWAAQLQCTTRDAIVRGEPQVGVMVSLIARCTSSSCHREKWIW